MKEMLEDMKTYGAFADAQTHVFHMGNATRNHVFHGDNVIRACPTSANHNPSFSWEKCDTIPSVLREKMLIEHVVLAHQAWRLQAGKYTLLRQKVLEIGSTSRVISAFLASVVHASSIQHGSQDVADQIFENVKLGKLLFCLFFWSPSTDRHGTPCILRTDRQCNDPSQNTSDSR